MVQNIYAVCTMHVSSVCMSPPYVCSSVCMSLRMYVPPYVYLSFHVHFPLYGPAMYVLCLLTVIKGVIGSYILSLHQSHMCKFRCSLEGSILRVICACTLVQSLLNMRWLWAFGIPLRIKVENSHIISISLLKIK